MANWQTKIDFSVQKNQYRSSEIKIQEVAKAAAQECGRIKNDVLILAGPQMAAELETIQSGFEKISEDENMDVKDFDGVLEDLYDWADTSLDGRFGGKKMCWVAP